ncbi:hypothetical protein BJP34_29520 [Moorena producens PAL-8-15-08-1]|uniref:Uncharacterized protein n=1 Tax=Moorena producens PAL-8-15-08-1 TaxID=1458985 RepID=A0A1D8TZM6_9CYAN|nr:hypothetical protein BJP34_29520 [Moorena producens PAL-8-15-08-1]
MGRWGDGEMGEIFIKRCSAVLGSQCGLGKAARSWGFPPETKPDYVEPLWLVGYAEKGENLLISVICAVLGVSPMSDCIKTRLNCLTVTSNHERLPWFPP